MHIKDLFVNRYREIRSGWRAALFVAVTGAALVLLEIPCNLLNADQEVVQVLVAFVSAMIGSYVLTRFVNRKPWTAIGLSLHHATFREFGAGCLLGFLMMAGVFAVEFATGYISLTWRGLEPGALVWIVISSLVTFLVGAAGEEILFRGYLLQTLMQGITFLPAALVMAAFFSFSHAPNPNVTTFALVNVGLAAMWLSIAYMKTRSLWLPIGLHFAWNFSQTTVFSFPTSGIEFADLRLFASVQSGPEWLTGGSFGPEGGALATLALLACTWYILKSGAISKPEGIITLDSLEDVLKPEGETPA